MSCFPRLLYNCTETTRHKRDVKRTTQHAQLECKAFAAQQWTALCRIQRRRMQSTALFGSMPCNLQERINRSLQWRCWRAVWVCVRTHTLDMPCTMKVQYVVRKKIWECQVVTDCRCPVKGEKGEVPLCVCECVRACVHMCVTVGN